MHELDEFKQDYDWRAAFNEAVVGDYRSYSADERGEPHPIDNVTAVYAASVGENDERDWIAVVEWEGKRFAVMRAGCDYTGWDCRAGGSIEYHDTLQQAVSKLTLTEEERQRLSADIMQLVQDGRVTVDW